MTDAGVEPPEKAKATQIIVFVAVVAFISLMSYGLLTARGSGPLSEGPAPPFTLSLLEGGELSLGSLRGQMVVVNFWASWCPPCRDEAPVLARVWQAYRDKGVAFVGIAYRDTAVKAQAFLDEFGITYPSGLDTYSGIARAYRIQGVPETFFITRDGHIAGVHIGPITEAKLTAVLNDLLLATEGKPESRVRREEEG